MSSLMDTLTSRQAAVFEFIKERVQTRGYGPTVREIGEHFGIASPNGVMCHLKALEKKDLIFIHVEAPDEAGHMGDAEKKIQAIEDFDEKVVGTILDGMNRWPEWKLLLLPDHPTATILKTHVSDPVPFVFFSSRESGKPSGLGYNEADARKTGVVVKQAHRLIEGLLGGSRPWIETSR